MARPPSPNALVTLQRGAIPWLDGRSSIAPLVTGIGPAQSVRAGVTFTCALLVDQSVWCWGDSQFGMQGFEGGVAAKPVTSGVTCWGKDGFGQAGVAKMPQVDTPTVLNLSDVNTVSAASFTTCFQRSSAPHGECMGENVHGELGLGNAGDGGPTMGMVPPPITGCATERHSRTWCRTTSIANTAPKPLNA